MRSFLPLLGLAVIFLTSTMASNSTNSTICKEILIGDVESCVYCGRIVEPCRVFRPQGCRPCDPQDPMVTSTPTPAAQNSTPTVPTHQTVVNNNITETASIWNWENVGYGALILVAFSLLGLAGWQYEALFSLLAKVTGSPIFEVMARVCAVSFHFSLFLIHCIFHNLTFFF